MTNIRDVLAQEAIEAEERAEAEARGDVEPIHGSRARRNATDASQVYSVRIPVARLEELRSLADAQGIAPSVLLRQWALERLEVELRKQSGSAHAPSLIDGGIKAVIEQLVNTAVSEALSPQRLATVLKATESIATGTRSPGSYRDPSGPIRLGATRRLAQDYLPQDQEGLVSSAAASSGPASLEDGER